MAAYQFIYVMKSLGKTYPGGREVLKDIRLSFLPGAKIGVLGANGAGKVDALKIMAGVEKNFTGEAWAAEGVSVGYLSQEPDLDPEKDVAGNVTEGLAEIKALLERFEEVSAKFGEELDEDEMNALIAEQGELQEKIEASNGWELDRTIEIAMDALRCPPGDADVTKLSGGERRRVALCRLLLQKPDLLLLDEPTNHLDAESVAWLQRFLHDYPGTVVTVTHDRYFLDDVAGWILELDRGQGIPYQGNYTGWLEQKQKRLAQEGKQEEARQRSLEHELEWVKQSPRARQAKSKARLSAYEDLLAQSKEKAPDTVQIVLPPGPRLGDLVIEAEHLSKGYGDRLLIDDLSFRLPPRRHRRHHWREWRRQDDAVPHDHQSGKARCRQLQGRRDGEARLCRSVARYACNPTRMSGRRFPAATTRSISAAARCRRAPMRRCSISAAPTSRRKSASYRAASATACIWPRC